MTAGRRLVLEVTVKCNLDASTELHCYLATMGPSHVQNKLPLAMKSFWDTCIMVSWDVGLDVGNNRIKFADLA